MDTERCRSLKSFIGIVMTPTDPPHQHFEILQCVQLVTTHHPQAHFAFVHGVQVGWEVES